MRPFRLVVAGGRDFGDANYLAEVLERSLADYAPAEVLSQLSESSPYGPLQIVSGGARGADSLGEQWAQQRGVPVQRYPARWDDLSAEGAVVRTNRTGQPYNANAGFARNEEMARNADAVLALPGGRGTDHMVRTALAMGLPVWDARSGKAEEVQQLLGKLQEPAVSQPRARSSSSTAEPPFHIVSSRGGYDVLGMRQKGQTMATVAAPGDPGWLGNPYVADDAGGSFTREQATAKFAELVESKAADAAWRQAFLDLEGKSVGYYKPEEEHIHLQALQEWIVRNRSQAVEPEQPAAVVNPTGQQVPVPQPRPPDVMRMAGDALPWILAAGGAGLLIKAGWDLAAPSANPPLAPYPPL